jgi:hypothetical protein
LGDIWNNKNNAHNTSSTKRKEDYPLSWFVSAFLAKIISTFAKNAITYPTLLPIQMPATMYLPK